MLSHSFDRCYVVVEFVLPTIKELKLSPIKFYSNCSYMNVDIDRCKFVTHLLCKQYGFRASKSLYLVLVV